MDIQSLSVVVPAKCMNRCPFCVSHLNQENKYFRKLHPETYLTSTYDNIRSRMKFVRDKGVDVMMITSTGEPLLNLEFVNAIIEINNKSLRNPFECIELQTSGVGLLEAIEQNRYMFSFIKTISISVVDIFDAVSNAEQMVMPNGEKVVLDELIPRLKKYGFNVRLSINMTNLYDKTETTPEQMFNRLIKVDVDQVTFRKLYKSSTGTKQDKWIDENGTSKLLDSLTEYIVNTGNKLERLPFGAMRYSVKGISTVVDDDCMNKEVKDVLKYMIIRENGKLYTKWDDKGSLIF